MPGIDPLVAKNIGDSAFHVTGPVPTELHSVESDLRFQETELWQRDLGFPKLRAVDELRIRANPILKRLQLPVSSLVEIAERARPQTAITR